jgi:hypothetical protein
MATSASSVELSRLQHGVQRLFDCAFTSEIGTPRLVQFVLRYAF